MVWDTWIDDILEMIIFNSVLEITVGQGTKFCKCPTKIAICLDMMFDYLIDLALVLEAS